MEVLDFGCGTGSTTISHGPFVRRIRAIDISSETIELARRKADRELEIAYQWQPGDGKTVHIMAKDAGQGHRP